MRSLRLITLVAIVCGVVVFHHWSASAAQRETYKCEYFASHEAAQAVYLNTNRVFVELDPDGNGIACDDKEYSFTGTIGSNADLDATKVVLTPAPSIGETVVPTEPGSSTDPAPTSASDQPANVTTPATSGSAIFYGDCTPGSFTNPIAILNDPATPSGSTVGTTSTATVASSYSSIPVSLETLLVKPTVLTIFDPATPGQLFACGQIGGIVAADGSLTIPLTATDGSSLRGIAYLGPDGSAGLGVSIFLAPASTATPAL